MLPRAQRLNTREFAVVFENARIIRHPLLQLRCYRHRENPEGGGREKSKQRKYATRAAFVAPKKLGNAVVRNAIRRRVRERYRVLQAEAVKAEAIKQYPWQAKLENCDLVFLATAQCAEAGSREIDESLIYLLKRAAQ